MSKKKKSTHRNRSGVGSPRPSTKQKSQTKQPKSFVGAEGIGIMESLAFPVYQGGWEISKDGIFDVRSTGRTHFELFPSGDVRSGLDGFEADESTQALMLAEHVWLTEDFMGHTVKPVGRSSKLARKYTFVHETGYNYCAVIVQGGKTAMYQENIQDRSTVILWGILRGRGEISQKTRAQAYIGFFIESTRFLSEAFRENELKSIKSLLSEPMAANLIATLFDKAAEERAATLGRDATNLQVVRSEFLHSLKTVDAPMARAELFKPSETDSPALRAFDELFGLAA